MHTKAIQIISVAFPFAAGDVNIIPPEYQHLLHTAHCVVAGKNIATNLALPPNCHFLTLSEALENNFLAIQRMLLEKQNIVFLCHGDPMYFGIGASLVNTFGHENVCIHTHGNSASMLQRICHQAGFAWHNVLHVSLHGRNKTKDWHALFVALFAQRPLCILTDKHSPPQRIAYEAMQRGARGTFTILERFGSEQECFEQVHIFELAKNASRETLHPCTLLFIPETATDLPHLGMRDTQIKHDASPMTKRNVRAAALSLLQLKRNSCFWDVGAGSGAICLEASALAYEGHVIAIESNIERISLIEENRQKYCATIIDICHAHAPYGLDELPRPQRIFIGGGLHKADAKAYLDTFCEALEPKGRMVISCVLLGTLQKVQSFFKQKNWNMELVQVSGSTSQALDTDLRLVPDNPVFLIAVNKP